MGIPTQQSSSRRTISRYEVSAEGYARLLAALSCSSAEAFPKIGGDASAPARRSSIDGDLVVRSSDGHQEAQKDLISAIPAAYGTFKLESVHRLEDYVLGGENADFEAVGLALSLRYSHQELPVPGLLQSGEDDCEFVREEVVSLPSRSRLSTEVMVKKEAGSPDEIPYILKDANVLRVDPLFEGSSEAVMAENRKRSRENVSSTLVREAMDRSKIGAIRVSGTFHTIRHTFLCVLPDADPTDGVSLVLDQHSISHGNPLGCYISIATPHADFAEKLLGHLDVPPKTSAAPTPSIMLRNHGGVQVPAEAPMVFRKDEGWMERESNEIAAEPGTEYDLAEEERKRRGRL
ncbi:hypothetical protein DFJ74DRAFT_704387 [Hyaloraphidium curvatum]|nr:hypothetical protein DFJ74DRAFT_704387 [Hyaloraphidium curvatum]